MKIQRSRSSLIAIALGIGAFHSVSASAISTSARRNNHGDVDTLSWGSCGENVTHRLECADFQVPLDWADESKGKIKLAVVRLPHDKTQPREGYMFYNPGGPGDSGINLVLGYGDYFQNQLGRSWDIVSWDPRGVVRSEPNLTLFDNEAANTEFWSQTEGRGHFEAHGNLTTQPDIDFFQSQAPAFDDLLQSLNDKYVEKFGDKLKYVGTPATVRDLVALTEAIYGQGADINYHGFSYGTILGAYLTQMFPDRIGKVIIDGVVDAFMWANTAPMAAIPISYDTSEGALQQFASYCAAAPSKCDLATAAAAAGTNPTGNATASASDIIAFIDNIYTTAYQIYDGSPLLNPDGSVTITGLSIDEISQFIFGSLYQTSTWPSLVEATILARALQLNATSGSGSGGTGNGNNTTTTTPKQAEIIAKMRKNKGPFGLAPNAASFPGALYAIACGDAGDFPSGSANTTTQDLFNIMVDIAKTTTSHFSSVFGLQVACHKWTSRAVERLPVPFTTKPKNVVLVIGNTFDPVTPYSTAQRLASEQHLGSMARLVKLNAVGHASVSNNSTCIDNVLHSFVRGDLPADTGNDEADVECEINGNPFDTL